MSQESTGGRGHHWWRWPLLVVLVALTLTCVAAFSIGFFTGKVSTNPVDLVLAFNGLVWMIPGLVVLHRANWHPVGWMLVGCGLGYAFSFSMGTPAAWDVFHVPHAWAAWVADGWGNSVAFAFTVPLLTLFPNGLSGTPRARRWGRLRIAAALIGVVVSGLGATVGGHEDATFSAESYRNPTGLGLVPQAVAGWFFLLILVGMIASALSLWRRSRHVDEPHRPQYTWVLFPFGLMISMIVVAIPLSSVLGDNVWLAVVLMYFAVPVAFSIGMVRFRLFDIDRVVSRTVSYAALALIIAGVYVLPVLVLPDLLGLSSDLAVAPATLAAAAVFAPLRTTVAVVVDRRFDRAHYDAAQLVAAFSGRLQTAVDLGRVTDELGECGGHDAASGDGVGVVCSVAGEARSAMTSVHSPSVSNSDQPSWIGTAVVIGAVTLYLALIGVGLALDEVVWDGLSAWTIYLLYATVGGLVLRHSARNPIGIFVAVMGVVPLLGNLGEGVAAHAAGADWVRTLAEWVRVWYFFVFLGAFVPLFHVFPTGRPLPGVWRWWYRGALLGSVVLVAGSMFGPSDDACASTRSRCRSWPRSDRCSVP